MVALNLFFLYNLGLEYPAFRSQDLLLNQDTPSLWLPGATAAKPNATLDTMWGREREEGREEGGDEGEEEEEEEDDGEGRSLCFLEEIFLEIGHFCGLQAGFGDGGRPTSELLRWLSPSAYTGRSLLLMWIPAYYLKRHESLFFSLLLVAKKKSPWTLKF